MKKVLLIIFFILINICISSASCNDISDHWCENNIMSFYDKGIIVGYPNGNFYPDQAITRIELFTIINNFFGFETDKKYDWEEENLKVAIDKGYADVNNIHGNVSREEVCVILSNLIELDIDISYEISFDDSNDVSNWAVRAISAFDYYDVVSGYPDNLIKAKDNITRAEVIQILANIDKRNNNFNEKVEETVIKIGYFDHNQYGLEIKEFPNVLRTSVGDTYQLAFSGVNDENVMNEFKIEILENKDDIITINDGCRINFVKSGIAKIQLQLFNYKKTFYVIVE